MPTENHSKIRNIDSYPTGYYNHPDSLNILTINGFRGNKLNNFSLADLLKYVFPSLVIYAYLLISQWGQNSTNKLLELINNSDILGIIAFGFLGSLIYLVYRALIYNLLIQPLQDAIRKLFSRKPFRRHNYRTYFKKRYERYSIGYFEAQQIYMQIKSKFLTEKFTALMHETASGIHLMYIAGISAIILSILGYLASPGFLIFGIFIFIAALVLDSSYEDILLRYILSLDENEMDPFVCNILDKLKSINEINSEVSNNDSNNPSHK